MNKILNRAGALLHNTSNNSASMARRQQHTSRVLSRIENYTPYTQYMPDSYIDLPPLQSPTKLTFEYQEPHYKSAIKSNQIGYVLSQEYSTGEEYDDTVREVGKFYESALLSLVDPNVDVETQLKKQRVCNQEVDEINILSLNVGIDLPILMSYTNDRPAEKSKEEYYDIIRGSMIESNFLRSDADFICLQNVPKAMLTKWLQGKKSIE